MSTGPGRQQLPAGSSARTSPRVDRYSQITVRTNRYSAPARLIGRQVRVMLHASEPVVHGQRVLMDRVAAASRPAAAEGRNRGCGGGRRAGRVPR
ncbi:Mu transposase domain-containing protein [Nonomuraea maheshkhaliensis]|uniref:Mu transposase domain-containing protein n=1 Tax=Nonomuraea maheshkhaliensis TaxID=419590 RepID=UPI003D15E28B